jgi:hypothetical protein
MVEQRTQDLVLDMIVLSFNCSRYKWKLKSPTIEGDMGKFESQINELQSRGDFLLNACVLLRSCINVFQISNSWSIIKISFAQGLANV